MPELIEQVDVDAPPEQVWAALVDWDRQGEWIALTDVRAVGDDVRALRISVAARGYRMSEVDWLLDQFAQVLDERDAEIAALRATTPPRTAGRSDVEDTDPAGVPVAAPDEGSRSDA